MATYNFVCLDTIFGGNEFDDPLINLVTKYLQMWKDLEGKCYFSSSPFHFPPKQTLENFPIIPSFSF